MKIDNNKKIEILLILLKERYEASHKMRERSLSFAIWILGFGILVAWLFLSRQICLTLIQKILFTVFLIIITVLTSIFLLGIEKGYKRNREVMIRIEKILGCYENNFYNIKEPLFPKEYMEIKNRITYFFPLIYIWIGMIAFILILFVWLFN